MQLHQIEKPNNLKSPKRVGRGGKRGTFSGKGTKGQKARAGHRIRPAIRDLVIRIPKLKGFKNKPLISAPIAVSLKDIEAKVSENTITRESLIKAGLLKKSEKRVKILSNGELKKSRTFKGLKVSKNAKEKIEAAGGKVEA